jgi:hypothetical protein
MKYIQAFTVGIAVICNVFVSAQTIAGTKLSNKQSVLNGKAFFNFPEAAANVERPVDIMSAGHNPNEETRIIYANGKEKLVFFAQELYIISDRNLFGEVSSDSAYKANFTSKVFTNNDSVLSILSTPLRYDTMHTPILIKSLLVQASDSTLFRIDAYINIDAFADIEQYKSLAENVFNTITKGTRAIKRTERNEKYYLLDSTQSFIFHLPVNFCVSVDQAYDFKVFKFHKLRGFNDNVWGDMLIYVGDHPSYVYMDYGLDQRGAKKDSGLFLGKLVSWLLFTDETRGVFLKEQIIPREDIGAGTMMHIAMVANTEDPFAELTEIEQGVMLTTK